MLRLVDLVKRYGDSVVVDGVSLTIAPGERVVLLGGSGSGKTTTLKMVNRLLEPDAGRVEIDGTDAATVAPHELRRRIGYCFQQVGLLPHLTIGENVGITPRLLGWDRDRIAARVDELLTMIELDPAAFRDRRPASLSGGQQQRVGVARALAAGPKIVLLDEPFGALDPLTRDRLQQSFLAIARQLALTVVFVTHDVLEALCVADRIAVMRAGRIEQLDTPQAIYERPATRFVAEFIGSPSMNLFACERHGDALRANGIELPLNHAQRAALGGGALLYGLRPESVAVAERGVPGTVLMVEPTGPESYVLIDTALGHLLARAPGRSVQRSGDPVHLAWRPEDAHLFDAASEQRLG